MLSSIFPARYGRWLAIAVALPIGLPAAHAEEASLTDTASAVEKAAVGYAAAFNAGDAAALADQWTARARLVEGGSRLDGREAIAASIVAWRKQHPQAKMEIAVDDVEVIAEPLARVSGRMRFTREPGARTVESAFTSIRVREDGHWRIAESTVTPVHATALDDLDWMLGSWHGEVGDRATIDITYEKSLNGFAIMGRTRVVPKGAGEAAASRGIEAVEIIHADRDAGLIRSWVFDSTGARAEGFFTSDGTSFEKTMAGTPSAAVRGREARWTQMIVPMGDDRVTTHMVERSIDGVPVPDAPPVNFRRVK